MSVHDKNKQQCYDNDSSVSPHDSDSNNDLDDLTEILVEEDNDPK